MYYNNKKDFFIKQYGKNILIGILFCCIIFCGSYILLLQNDTTTQRSTTIISGQVDNEIDTYTEETIVTEKTNTYFDTLEKLTLSKELSVTKVEKDKITLEDNTSIITVSMIGLSYEYSEDNIYDVIKEDLLDKKVKIAFDKSRDDNNVYIYLEDKLYNATLLEKGLVTIKTETTNTSLRNTLSNAQKKARDSQAGIWN